MAAAVHTHIITACVCGHHIYKSIWTPVIGEILNTEQEHGNEHDEHAVAILHQELGIVGHIPKKDVSNL